MQDGARAAGSFLLTIGQNQNQSQSKETRLVCVVSVDIKQEAIADVMNAVPGRLKEHTGSDPFS